MEIFGLLIGLPIIFVVSLFLPRFIHKFLQKSAFVRWVVVLLAGIIFLSLAVELALISKFGIVEAHDRFHPLLDRMQGYNTVFGPIALTGLSVLWTRKMPLNVMKWCAGFICFCAFTTAALGSLFYDDAAHYRADSEGVYRIEEK